MVESVDDIVWDMFKSGKIREVSPTLVEIQYIRMVYDDKYILDCYKNNKVRNHERYKKD